jgi:hypothetical protein
MRTTPGIRQESTGLQVAEEEWLMDILTLLGQMIVRRRGLGLVSDCQ